MSVSQILKQKGRDVITASPGDTVQSVAETLGKMRIGAVVVSSGGGKIDEVVVVDDERSEVVLVTLLAKAGNVGEREPGAFPLPRARRKDLHRVRADGDRSGRCID